jgi:[protein-PII] uridylyltransferase
LGENVEDVFFISDHDNKPITNPVFIQQLQEEIRKQLDAETAY